MTVLFLLLSPTETDSLTESFLRLTPEIKICIASDCNEARSILATSRIDLLICRCPRNMMTPTAGSESERGLEPCQSEESSLREQSSADLLLNPPLHLPPILFVRETTDESKPSEKQTALSIPLSNDGELLDHLQRLFPARFSILLIHGPNGNLHQIRTSTIDAICASRGGSVVHTTGNSLHDHRTMTVWTRILPTSSFARLDRSTIVRTSAIKVIFPLARGAKLQFKSATIMIGRKGFTELRRIMTSSPESV